MSAKSKFPVFDRINGELVRVPGDIQDPNKKYTSLIDENGQQVIQEFSEQDYKQAAEDEARWIAERPKREAERKRQQEEFEAFKQSLKYEDRIVAFIDILGWKSAIDQSRQDPELVKQLGITVNAIQKQIEMNAWLESQVKGEAFGRITHFSDSVVVSVKADKLAQSSLVSFLERIVLQFFQLGYVVRGGIAFGPLLHKGSMVFGPAMVKAYELEKCANYPRILLDQSLAQIWGKGESVFDKFKGTFDQIQYWRKDADGRVFFDFLQPFPIGAGARFRDTAHLEEDFKRKRQFIFDSIKKFEKYDNVASKYQWMATYFNSLLSEYPGVSVSPISV